MHPKKNRNLFGRKKGKEKANRNLDSSGATVS